MKKAYLLLIAFIAFASLANAQDWLNGSWKGTGYQADGLKWKINIDVIPNSSINVNYPDLGCSGHWMIKGTKAGTVIVEETITTGVDKCDQGVEVSITKINKNELALLFYLRSVSSEPIATAKVRK